MSHKTTLIIADDHPIFRSGLVNVLKSKQFDIVGEAENGEQALEMIKLNKPDVAIIDIDMPVLNGLEVCERIKNEELNVKVVALTLFKEEGMYRRAIELGVYGYILKDQAYNELVEAIKLVASGERYFSKSVEGLLTKGENYLVRKSEVNNAIAKLTSTERKILKFVSEGLSKQEIAKRLFISENTVHNHRYSITKKLELESKQNSLLQFVMENKPYLFFD